MPYKKKLPKTEDTTKPCKCGTGHYCHRHLKYDVPLSQPEVKLFKSRERKRNYKEET
jgi:hypothetical protein